MKTCSVVKALSMGIFSDIVYILGFLIQECISMAEKCTRGILGDASIQRDNFRG